MRPRELSSTVPACGKTLSASVNILCHQEPFRQLLSTFCAAGRPTDHICQLSVPPGVPSVNKRQITVWPVEFPSTFRAAERHSVNFPSGQDTFRYLSTPPGNHPLNSFNFRCSWQTFHQLLLTFCAAGSTSVTFCQLSQCQGYFPSTSVNFPCGWETFCHFLSTFRLAGKFPSPFFNFPCSPKTFLELPSTFRAVGRPSVNFL